MAGGVIRMAQIKWKTNESMLIEDKTSKLNELKAACTDAIHKGFTSTLKGYEFGFNEHDQANFTQQLLLIVNGQADNIQWKTKNAGVVNLTVEDFNIIINDSKNHKLAQQQKYWELENQVNNATTKQEVESIIW